MNTRNAKHNKRAIEITVENHSGISSAKGRTIAPKSAIVTISKNLSTTTDERPCEYVAPAICFKMKSRTKSPSLAGIMRFAVCDTYIQAVDVRILTEITSFLRIYWYLNPRRNQAKTQIKTAIKRNDGTAVLRAVKRSSKTLQSIYTIIPTAIIVGIKTAPAFL